MSIFEPTDSPGKEKQEGWESCVFDQSRLNPIP